MPKLKKRVKEQWVAALRSGKYRQGQSSLAEGGKYCCLGVLCEVALENRLPLNVEDNVSTYGDPWRAYDGESSFLPKRVYEWATLKKGRGPLRDDFDLPGGTNLVEANDTGKTFEEIADLIEEHL
jgi:hypothetical protein